MGGCMDTLQQPFVGVNTCPKVEHPLPRTLIQYTLNVTYP